MSDTYADFEYGGETYKTWYRVIGDLKSDRRPLVLLHGGPGVTSGYLTSIGGLYATFGIPVVLYDQIGCGKSTHLPEKPPSFWSIPLFVSELDNLLSALGIANSKKGFDLLGHSWGGVLGLEYTATRQPAGLKHLVLADTFAAMSLWEESLNKLLDKFPSDFAETLRRLESEGKVGTKEYQERMPVFFAQHMCRINPFPQVLVEGFQAVGADPSVPLAMCVHPISARMVTIKKHTF